jgi:hypothetical protein
MDLHVICSSNTHTQYTELEGLQPQQQSLRDYENEIKSFDWLSMYG